MNAATPGVLLGLVFAIGLLTAVAGLRRSGRPGLARRIAWHAGGARLEDASRSSWTDLRASLAPSALGWRRDPARDPLAPSADVAARLARAGRDASPQGVERYRLTQLGWAITGLIGGSAAGLMLASTGASFIGVVLLAAIGAVIGLLAADRSLVRHARRRERRIRQELPTVAELLAFAVAAGEPPVLALERVAVTVRGDLAREVHTAIADLRVGMRMNDALRGIAHRCGTSEVDRFIDGLVVALERGTPIAEVLRAQAADARASQRHQLMELAGRKDVAMLVPVVFLILPTVILVALYPGFTTLQLIVP